MRSVEPSADAVHSSFAPKPIVSTEGGANQSRTSFGRDDRNISIVWPQVVLVNGSPRSGPAETGREQFARAVGTATGVVVNGK